MHLPFFEPELTAHRQIVGSILVSLMLQICNQRYPLNYRLPVYIMWGPVGAILLCFLVLPESPWFYARKYNREASIKSLQALYGNVKDYDLEEEYDIILRNLEHEKNLEGEAKSVAWRDILRGINLVSKVISPIKRDRSQVDMLASTDNSPCIGVISTIWRSCIDRFLLNL